VNSNDIDGNVTVTATEKTGIGPAIGAKTDSILIEVVQ